VADCCCSPLGPSTAPGAGDVSGPDVAVAGNLAVFADTTGKVIADGGPPPAATLKGVTAPVNLLVPAQDTAFIDFAIPGLTASHRIILNVNSDPTTSGIGIAGAWCTPGGNTVRVGFINAKPVAVTVSGFSLVYWATL
jgi:hypothetical protein